MAAALKLVCVLVLCMLVFEPTVTNAVTCGDVLRRVSGCLRYLQKGGAVPRSCCAGVRAINSLARTTRDRRTACRCLQNAAKLVSGLKSNLALRLPGKCGVRIPYKISTSTNCNKVK